MSTVDTIKSVFDFASPIIEEGISLAVSYFKASRLEQAELIARRDAALLEMRGAQQEEKDAHIVRTAETLRQIEEAERTKP